MDLEPTLFFNGVDGSWYCTRCRERVVKNGRTKGGKQRYHCRLCKTTKVLIPEPNRFGDRYDEQIIRLLKEGCGIRSIARLVGIGPATVTRKILLIAANVQPPALSEKGLSFQVDELHTCVGKTNRKICVIYSWNASLHQAFSLSVGTRSKASLRKVIEPLLLADARRINTDGYSGYEKVIPLNKHTISKRRNNHIERKHLSLRTHLKRLQRRTICFSRSAEMLEAVVRIYLWG